jgi:hypothetical protein
MPGLKGRPHRPGEIERCVVRDEVLHPGACAESVLPFPSVSFCEHVARFDVQFRVAPGDRVSG